jgi:inosine-uridine nucleoside N-ribohydrolase
MKETKMKDINRREIFSMAATGLAATVLHPRFAYADKSRRKNPRTPVLHATDLFRPHIDPDDHWDVACVYALAYRGDIDLKGIVIDYPPRSGKDHNPDIAAVAQMNLIAGIFVPVAVGTALPMKSRNDVQAYASSTDHHGVRMVLEVLAKSPQPVVINILGSSRNIAIAGKKDPDLFASKCAAIYLNAGTGSPDRSLASKLEYNVTLDKSAYAAIFDLPCPVYWMPCFERIESDQQRSVSEYGTHYKFRQDQILPHLSDMVQNYFAYMFGRYTDHNWLLYLKRKKDEALLGRFASQDRHMWCTAGFLHEAGYTASRDGDIVPLDEVTPGEPKPVFSFDPIRVRCDDSGVTEWAHDENSKNRFIFHVRDAAHYQSATTYAMKSLLVSLP